MRWLLTISAIAGLLIGGLVAMLVLWQRAPVNPPPPATSPTAKTALPMPATRLSSARPTVQAYSDLIRSLPGFADSEFSQSVLPLEQAARIELNCHVYICPRQDLWIAHPDAPSIAQISDEGSRGVHLTREQVVFVHWAKSGRQLKPIHILRDDKGAYRVFNRTFPSSMPTLPRFDYQWDRAMSAGDVIVVPTDQGVAAIQPTREPRHEYRALSSTEDGNIQVALTPTGFIAWAPAFSPDSPDKAVACFSDGAWRDDLPAKDWQGPFVHLVPFSDGSVLQIRPTGPAKVSLAIAPLDVRPADAARVRNLVRDLGDEDAETRDRAHAELASLGPAAWSILEQLMPTAQGEVQVRLQEIVQYRTQPTLGRFKVIDDQLQSVWRLRDGVVFLAEQGMQVGDAPPVTPAWISLRRGHPIALLPPALTRGLAIGSTDLYAAGNEWVVSSAAEGAKLFFGQEFLPLNREKDLAYRQLVGIDRMNRILLRPADGAKYPMRYLLVDPGIPDPTPMIQVWEMSVPAGEVGWDEANWPAVKRQEAYTLREDHWEPLKAAPIATPATQPSADASQADRRIAQAGENEVWIGGGLMELRSKSRPVARQAIPKGLPSDVLAGAIARDRLYLLHPAGRISQLAIRPQAEQPFALQAVFTQDVPDVRNVLRMWVDPAGRVCIVTDNGRLIIIFTERKIPPAILDMIPAGELKQARPAQ